MELFVGNLTEKWEQEEDFTKAMKEFGVVERLAIIRNPDGESKVGTCLVCHPCTWHNIAA